MTFEPWLKQTTSQGQKYPWLSKLGWGRGGVELLFVDNSY